MAIALLSYSCRENAKAGYLTSVSNMHDDYKLWIEKKLLRITTSQPFAAQSVLHNVIKHGLHVCLQVGDIEEQLPPLFCR